MRLRNQLLLSAVAAAIAIWFFGSPYLAVHNMKAAIQSGDAASFNDYVDFPALKENIKGTMNAKLVSATSKGKTQSKFEELGTALAAAMIGQLVEAFITPESVAMMMKGDKPRPGASPKSSKDDEEPVNTSMSYESINRFVLTATKKTGKAQPISLVFRREGVFFWKLSAIRLPE